MRFSFCGYHFVYLCVYCRSIFVCLVGGFTFIGLCVFTCITLHEPTSYFSVSFLLFKLLSIKPLPLIPYLYIFTARKRSLGQGNIFTPVCHSVHRGVCLSACWDTLWDHAPPPRTMHPCPLGPCTSRDHAPSRPCTSGPCTPPSGTRHRTWWEIRSTRGRYASYWNAILCPIELCVIAYRTLYSNLKNIPKENFLAFTYTIIFVHSKDLLQLTTMPK